MSNQTSQPLAWSQSGDPIELPATAVLWRVRRCQGGKGGAPEIVYGLDGLPLAVDIGIAPDDFAEAVERRAGKYRLDALDQAKRPIAGVPPAYVMVAGAIGRGDLTQGEPHEVAIRTLSDALTRQTTQIATIVDACARLIAAVDNAGVSRREPPPQLVAIAPDATAERRNGRRDDDKDDEDDDDLEDEESIMDKAAEFIRKAGPDGVRAAAQAVPQMVGGIIKEVRNAVGGEGGGKP